MNYKNTSKAIKALRITSGLTGKSIAENINMAPHTYAKLEKGITLPDMVQIFDLCTFFNVSIDYFIFMILMDIQETQKKPAENLSRIFAGSHLIEKDVIDIVCRYGKLPSTYRESVDDFLFAAEVCADCEI